MITEIQLENFKSFVDSGRVLLSGVNLFAGANSSGKSSLIQSILLLKQTLQYGAEGRPITLNGPILRLGSLNDVRRRGSGSSPLSISIRVKLDEARTRGASVSWYRRLNSTPLDGGHRLMGFELKIEIGDSPDDPFESSVRNSNGSLISTIIKYEIEDKDGATIPLTAEVIPRHPSRSSGYIKLDDYEIQRIAESFPDPIVSEVLINKFLPSILPIEYEAKQNDIRSLTNYLLGANSLLSATHPAQDENIAIEIIETVKLWANEINIESDVLDTVRTNKDLRDAIGQLNPNRLGMGSILSSFRIPSYLEPRNSDLRSLITTTLDHITPSKRETSYLFVQNVDKISDWLQAYFKEGIRYLGPLREAPRPVYQPEAMESFTNVGYRGEHTAAVVEINRSKPVTYVEPIVDVTDDNIFPFKQELKLPLNKALIFWLTYLGVATSVSTEDAGVYGNRLQVSIHDPSFSFDLTNVGVGVSQVLPILVSTLLAPPSSLMIFEQPELHLHPKVQSRLADFFISACMAGKQIILETHSEYIVDRLRLRIAQSEDASLQSMISIQFVEQREGASRVSDIRLSEFGVVANWPADFFDFGERDSALILEAARRKRSKKARK